MVYSICQIVLPQRKFWFLINCFKMSTNFLRLLNKTTIKCMKLPGSLPRILNCYMTTSVSTQKLQKERYSFQEMLPNILECLERNPKLSEVPEVASWIRKVLEYNMDGGKKIRGLVTVHAFESMAKPHLITEESLKLARVMGWCVEMLQSYLLVLDDIMDGSKTRRGVPCWYRIPEVGLGAINDTIFIHMSLFQTLNTYFADNPNYSQIVDLFNEVLLFTSIGQHLDYTTAHRKNDYSLFTIDRYMAIIKYKTAYYTYKLPVSLGLLLANITDKKIHKKYEDICLELGKLFQMQDDYLDCYGEENLTGKSGTDIQEGKCTWFAVQALSKCNPNQRVVFTTCYGSNEPAHIERIQRLYDQLGLQQLYSEHESAVYNKIVKQCEDLQASTSLSSNLIMNMLDMIYKRKQ